MNSVTANISPYNYVLRPSYLVVRDKPRYGREEALKRLRFHVKVDDYFATLATLLGFVEEKLTLLEKSVNKGQATSLELSILNEMQKDLMYLQKNYHICERKNTEIR